MWPAVALGLCLLCLVLAAIAASQACWMEEEAREQRRVASMQAWRARSFAYQSRRDAETVRLYAARMTGDGQ